MASKRHLRERECTGKYRYRETERDRARFDAREVQAKNPRYQVGVYKCRFCRYLHVGHTPVYILRRQI